ncbi:hypothetical protein HK101_009640 [Irineochytrium annulatum]|nr:hypothetical protein HK101_009640 [Irineochytrium annulatum]
MTSFTDALAAAGLASDLADTKRDHFTDDLGGLDAPTSPQLNQTATASPNDFLWAPDMNEAENTLIDFAGDASPTVSALSSPALSFRARSPPDVATLSPASSAAGSPLATSPRRRASNLQILTRPTDFNLNSLFEGLSDQQIINASASPMPHHPQPYHPHHGLQHPGPYAPAEYAMPPPTWPHHAPYYAPQPAGACPCQGHHPMTPMSASMMATPPPHHHHHHGYYPYPHPAAHGHPGYGGSAPMFYPPATPAQASSLASTAGRSAFFDIEPEEDAASPLNVVLAQPPRNKVKAPPSPPLEFDGTGIPSPIKMKRLQGAAARRQSSAAFSASQISGAAKVFKCPYEGCGRVFPRQYNLKSHVFCHTGERPHVCTLCRAAFARKHDLQRHTRTLHAEDRPYKCPRCNQGFTRPDQLARHRALEEQAAAVMADGRQINLPDHVLERCGLHTSADDGMSVGFETEAEL